MTIRPSGPKFLSFDSDRSAGSAVSSIDWSLAKDVLVGWNGNQSSTKPEEKRPLIETETEIEIEMVDGWMVHSLNVIRAKAVVVSFESSQSGFCPIIEH